MKKNNLDEMQEQELLKIEHNGCWLAYWGLLAVLAAQMIIGVPFSQVIGEWVVLMVLCLYIVIACLRKGIWGRRLKANWRTNLIGSLIAGTAVGVLTAAAFRGNIREPLDFVLIACIPAVCTFALCFGVLTLSMKLYKKRREKLEQE